jgi:hypothetical protein
MRFAVCSLALLWVSSVFATEPDKPSRFADLIKVGDKIGYTRDSDTGVYYFHVYSPDVFEIVAVSKTLDENELEDTFPVVAAAKRRAIEAEKKAWQDRLNQIPQGKKLSYEARFSVAPREQLATVEQVGEDYVMLSSMRDRSGRYAIALRWVTSIGWRNEVPVLAYTRFVSTE